MIPRQSRVHCHHRLLLHGKVVTMLYGDQSGSVLSGGSVESTRSAVERLQWITQRVSKSSIPKA
eukprot:scaffold11843_cov152-Amphora_coffeaeformis.AAC.3